MGMNVFEGARRIAFLVKVVWVMCVAAVAYSIPPAVTVKFVTTDPRGGFAMTEAECDLRTDAVEWVTRWIDSDRWVTAELCFKAQDFASSDRPLVPYKIDRDGSWGNSPHSRQVAEYTDARAERFTLTAANSDAARAAWDAARSRHLWYAVLFAIGGWVAISLAQAVIGWIVRGFVGIPLGHDHAA